MESRRLHPHGALGALPGRALALALASAVLHVLVLPPFDRGWVAFVALVPLLVALRLEERTIWRVVVCAAFGLVSVAGTIHWLPAALIGGNGFGPLSALVVSAGVLGWYTACFALFPLLLTWLDRGGLPRAMTPALAWVAMEAARDAALPALTWTVYGHALHDTLPLLQLAELAGAPGLSFALMLVNGLLADAWAGGGRASRGWRQALALAAAAAFVGGLVVVGYARLAAEEALRSEGPRDSFAVGAVQVAVPQADRWLPGTAGPRIEDLLTLSASALGRGAELVVWPETAIEVHLEDAEGLDVAVANVLGRYPGSMLLAGAPREETGAGGPGSRSRYFNSAVLFGDRGGVRAIYDKVSLYPVSEYMPAWLLAMPGADRVFASQLRWLPYTPGRATQPLVDAGVKLGVLICGEGILAGVARARASAGAQVLVHLANDAVIPGSAAAAQHFAVVRVQAVALRRPLVRASNLGVTAVVDASGRVLDRSPSGRPGVAVAWVVPRSQLTPYGCVGWTLPMLCVTATVLGGLTPADIRLVRWS